MPSLVRATALVAQLSLALALVASSADASATHTGAVHTSAVTSTGLQVRSAQLTQTGKDVEFTVELNADRARFDLDAKRGGGICALPDHGAATEQICLARSHRVWHAFRGPSRMPEPVETIGERGLSVRFPLADLSPPSGTFKWAVRATSANCAAGATACRGRLPAKGELADRLWQPYPISCTRAGDGQVTRGPSGSPRIALTFDDGPSAYTASLRAVLRRNHAVATFFELGAHVRSRAAEVRGLLSDGNELGNHSWNHANLGGGGPGASSQMAETNAAIAKATGFTPCLFRPPYGSTGADLVSRANGAGMTSVLWSVDTNDWQLPGRSTIASRVLAGAADGAIVLMHDGGGPRADSVAAAAAVIPVLKARGFHLVTVSQLLGNPTTYGLRPPS